MIDPIERWPLRGDVGFRLSGTDPDQDAGIDFQSQSRLNTFRESPQHFWWRYILGNKDKDTPAKREGAVIHKCLLETEEFLAGLRVEPDPSRYPIKTKDDLWAYLAGCGVEAKKSASKADLVKLALERIPQARDLIMDVAVADFEASVRPGQFVLSAPQAERFTHIVRAVRRHPSASKLLCDGTPEVTGFWPDPEFGLLWRGRIDYLKIVGNRAWVIDVKSARSAKRHEFQRDSFEHGYHIQNWVYRRIVSGITGLETNIVQVVVEKDEPYCVMTYTPDEQSYETAYWEIGRLLERMDRCRMTDTWPSYNDGEVEAIGIPSYALWAIEEEANREVER